MTNAQIIFAEAQRLAAEGIISYTGREFKGQDSAGNAITIKETEPIHTFAAWKELGFSVKKGEHAIAKFTIWKYRKKKAETDEETDTGKMFMKTAHFFKASQVEAIA